MRKLTRNAAKCLLCGDVIESKHVHNYVTTVRWEADCVRTKDVWDICSCGDFKNCRSVEEKLGHDFGTEIVWDTPPTCTSGGTYSIWCNRCNGYVGGFDGEPLGHTFEDTILNPDRDCFTPARVKHHCTVCGWDEMEDDWSNKGEHVYKTCPIRDYDLVNHCWYTYEIVKCSCGALPPGEE